MHTRRYVQRSAGQQEKDANYSATVILGSQADFDYDALAELVFDDESQWHVFFEAMSREEVRKELAKDEELFVDREKMKIVIVDDYAVTAQ